MEANFVFIGESDGDAALRVGGGGFVEIGFGEDEDGAGLASSMAARTPATPEPMTTKSA